MKVQTDWLDVTYAPDDVPEPELRALLLGAGFQVAYDKGHRLLYVPPSGHGALVVMYSTNWAKISLSGSVCSHLRDIDHWLDVLSILSSSPHTVTRLDPCLDLPLDAADVIAGLTLRYPDGKCSLGRKALPIKRILETRPDGKDSGTFYVGHMTKARATARVYDKTLERLQRAGIDLGYNLTRFEATVRRDYGATLRDAAEPDALFWHVMCPALLTKKPAEVPMWLPGNDLTGWEHTPRVYAPAEVLQRRVEHSAELEALGLLADDLGSYGRSMLLSLISRRLGLDSDSDLTAAC